jgi:hypothetical protein
MNSSTSQRSDTITAEVVVVDFVNFVANECPRAIAPTLVRGIVIGPTQNVLAEF